VVVRRRPDDGVSCDGDWEETEDDWSSGGYAVGYVSGDYRENGGDGIRWDCEELRSNGGIAKTLDDGGDKQPERVEGGEDREVRERGQPSLDGKDRLTDSPPTERFPYEDGVAVIVETKGSVGDESSRGDSALLLGEEAGFVDGRREDNDGEETDDGGHESLNDDDPAPAGFASSVADLIQPGGQETAKARPVSTSKSNDSITHAPLSDADE